jgi:hypothetical protein
MIAIQFGPFFAGGGTIVLGGPLHAGWLGPGWGFQLGSGAGCVGCVGCACQPWSPAGCVGGIDWVCQA